LTQGAAPASTVDAPSVEHGPCFCAAGRDAQHQAGALGIAEVDTVAVKGPGTLDLPIGEISELGFHWGSKKAKLTEMR
jgi:hypothetical protein